MKNDRCIMLIGLMIASGVSAFYDPFFRVFLIIFGLAFAILAVLPLLLVKTEDVQHE